METACEQLRWQGPPVQTNPVECLRGVFALWPTPARAEEKKGRPLSAPQEREGRTAPPQTCLHPVPPVGWLSMGPGPAEGSEVEADDLLALSGHLAETSTDANRYIY